MLHLRIHDDNIPITRFNYLAFYGEKNGINKYTKKINL